METPHRNPTGPGPQPRTGPPPPPAPAAYGEAAQEAPAEAPRILVVDDEPSVVDVLVEYLSGLGYALDMAGSAEEAQRLIPRVAPAVIITDINLPGMSGLEVVRMAKSHDPEVAVIVVTGYASTATAIEALRHGACDYVTKPFDLDAVHQIVERQIANRHLKALNRRLVEELREKNVILERHEQELVERVGLATRQMRTLYEIGQEVGADLELRPRLKRITAHAAQLSGARVAVTFLRPWDLEEYVVMASHGAEPAPRDDGDLWAMETEGPLADAVARLQPVRVSGAAIAIPGFGHESFANLLAVPLTTEGDGIGVLALLDKPGGFDDEDRRFLSLFAAQSAIAIRNSQLYEHTKDLDRLKSEFVAVVSHEIRTPLTSIKGSVELLSDPSYFAIEPQQAKLLQIALANTERLLVLIGDILDFSKLETASLPMEFEVQPLEPVVNRAFERVHSQLEEHSLRTEIDLAPDLPTLPMDAGRVAQVLVHLLSNAIKFSPPGGCIKLRARVEGDAVRVAVTDQGGGIPAQDQPRLFRKFSQLDSSATRKAGGTGLGLVLCKSIVELHGGAIGVDSVEGAGSTFHFTLPLRGRHALAPAA